MRTGGQAIDVHGKALDVVARMGLLEQVRAAETGIRGMDFVDASWATTAGKRSTPAGRTGAYATSPGVRRPV